MSKLKSTIQSLVETTRRDCLATIVNGYKADYRGHWQALGYQSKDELEQDLAASESRKQAKQHLTL
ncbi:hypothetical protein C9I98_01675 [Photobacterium sanctipauli]|uniref:Uncharacterized protein n=1 Tax=Photobacterium sanctipauli TaxID=1342794 RepID=A0A2T3P0J6_9GAMM|nr:hypothetical protein [Photobacterium sanctipauli]PSW21998.1 hypothetical protein C9I98_01675 [Photobacterium sanctipauli]